MMRLSTQQQDLLKEGKDPYTGKEILPEPEMAENTPQQNNQNNPESEEE
jgi:hypothetical protein